MSWSTFNSYLSHRKAELLASGEVLVETYFNENISATLPKGAKKRIINTLIRAEIETMNQLCAESDDELAIIREVGPKTLDLILQMSSKYMTEQGNREIKKDPDA